MADSSIASAGASHNPRSLDTDKLSRCTGAVTMAVDVLNQFHGDAEGMEHIVNGLMLAREGLLELCDTQAAPEKPTPATKTETPVPRAADVEDRTSRDELESAIKSMDRHSQETFDEIEALAELAAATLDQAHSRKVRLHLRTLLSAIAYKAADTMNEINSTAEGVGCNYKKAREVGNG